MDFKLISEILGAGVTLSSPFIVKHIQKIRKKRAERKQDFYNKIDEIHYELKLNGGKSLKDVVITLRDKISNVEDGMYDITEIQKLSMNIQGVSYFITDAEGDVVYASPALCSIVKRNESELKGRNWLTWIIPEDKERVLKAWEFAVDNHSSFDEIFYIKGADEGVSKIHVLAFPKMGKHNNFTGLVGKILEYPEL